MTDPKEIYLAPACHAEMEEGRTWAEDQAWDDCHDCGNEPVRYVLASDYDALAAERDELRTALAATDKLASEAAQRNEDMGRELEALREDAERFRFVAQYGWPECLRQIHPTEEPPFWAYDSDRRFSSPAEAIDDARAQLSRQANP